MSHARLIATELKLDPAQVERTLALFAEGATLPFVARYRKEVTGNLDEVQLGKIIERSQYLGELDARKKTVLDQIRELGKLTPELEKKITLTLSKTELEDLYLPYKPKRRTRAMIARERGLEPLAARILTQASSEPSLDELAKPYLDAEKGVPDVETAFAGARDIIAEQVADRADVRAELRKLALAEAEFTSAVLKGKEEEGKKFSDYFDLREPARTIPSHRMLAMRRGEAEGFLRVKLDVNRTHALDRVRASTIEKRGQLIAELERAVDDAYDRLIFPAIEVDIRLQVKDRADGEAISVFADNLRNLLLQSPLGGKSVLAVDPGYRTGCKVVVIDTEGNLKQNEVIYPSQSDAQRSRAEQTVEALCKKYSIEAIAIGNGTAGRETEAFVRKLKSEQRIGAARIVVVNESGASIYSASEVAREELPDQDVTVRGAVSIGRRLQDPLAELVKIDPKSIGVGQYQHDVNQSTLKKSLDAVVESCVNHVGVDLNTASVKLLSYVAGIGETLARNIVQFRAQKGRFVSRKALLEVPRLGGKAFEQAAGFLRVRDSAHPLDNSAVHPESYDVVAQMANDLGVDLSGLVGRPDVVRRIDAKKYVTEERGLPTLTDILAELEKPGRDPRAEFEDAGFDPNVTEFEHVKADMVLAGVVTNVTQFGAFVDIGVHQDGLVHISELSSQFVRDPKEVVRVGQRVKVRVLTVDVPRRRIGLSMKQAAAPAERPMASASPKPRPTTTGPNPSAARPSHPRPTARPEVKPQTPFNNPFAALRKT